MCAAATCTAVKKRRQRLAQSIIEFRRERGLPEFSVPAEVTGGHDWFMASVRDSGIVESPDDPARWRRASQPASERGIPAACSFGHRRLAAKMPRSLAREDACHNVPHRMGEDQGEGLSDSSYFASPNAFAMAFTR
jgi:hypothetical protein